MKVYPSNAYTVEEKGMIVHGGSVWDSATPQAPKLDGPALNEDGTLNLNLPAGSFVRSELDNVQFWYALAARFCDHDGGLLLSRSAMRPWEVTYKLELMLRRTNPEDMTSLFMSHRSLLNLSQYKLDQLMSRLSGDDREQSQSMHPIGRAWLQTEYVLKPYEVSHITPRSFSVHGVIEQRDYRSPEGTVTDPRKGLVGEFVWRSRNDLTVYHNNAFSNLDGFTRSTFSAATDGWLHNFVFNGVMSNSVVV